MLVHSLTHTHTHTPKVCTQNETELTVLYFRTTASKNSTHRWHQAHSCRDTISHTTDTAASLLEVVHYQQAKNQVFRPAGRLVAPIQVKLCRTDGHLGPLGCALVFITLYYVYDHVNRCRGLGMRPQKYKKKSTFW